VADLPLGVGPITPSYIPPETTAHAICRVCGRILRVSIPHEEVATLHAFSDRRPDGWTVEGMSFSFTGICPQCRQGRTD
jgi:Fe2+ or Zn2+ uptake regulation protein